MRYTELLDRFWGTKWSKSHNEIVLFHYLLYRCSSLGWPDTFSVSNEELMQTLKCSPNTVRAARKALVDTGLICYKQGDGRGGLTFYSFVADDETDEEKKGSSRVHLSAKRVQVENTFSNVSNSKSADDETDEEKKGSSRVHLSATLQEKQNKKDKEIFPEPLKEKKKINKKKTLSLNRVRVHTCESGQEEIVFKEVEEDAKERLNKRPEPPKPNLPESLEEVIAFFETNAADKIPDWKEVAEAFYYHYQSYGWNGTSNRKIVDWESKANAWICDNAIKHKQTKNNHATTTINNTSNDRAASDREAQELVNRLLRENRIEDETVSRRVQP